MTKEKVVPKAVTMTDLDAVVEEWLAAQAGFKRYVDATENLYVAFAEGWCGPRRGLPEAFANFRAAILRESEYRLLEVSVVYPQGRPEC